MSKTLLSPSPAPYVVFDLDDVLANLREVLMIMLNRRTGHTVHWRDWRQYELSGVYGTPIETILEWVREDAVLEAARPDPHARGAIEAAREAGFRVAILTARGWHPRGDALTRAWLEDHDLVVEELHLVDAFATKAEVLGRLGEVAYFIDDHLGHVHSARDVPTVRQALVLDRPWNRQDPDIPRIRGLEEFMALLQPVVEGAWERETV